MYIYIYICIYIYIYGYIACHLSGKGTSQPELRARRAPRRWSPAGPGFFLTAETSDENRLGKDWGNHRKTIGNP